MLCVFSLADAASLAKQLVMVETALRDPNVSGAQLAWMGHLQQLAYSRLADYPDWKDTVLGALPVSTRSAVLGSLEAGKQLRSMGGPIPSLRPRSSPSITRNCDASPRGGTCRPARA